ncbi:hypothetical protein [Rufibacter tibetensis]|uniref:Lipoprotein n=1 Tax=Rufibacter tibetensis TaxID=512763 RepID=A0A0P0C9C9_9BACT|nr:hypothetical protein [Rufibacter tibetensis]ALJ00178.1 hypothetical protein DC20_15920 [Rufibacter tibetensis]
MKNLYLAMLLTLSSLIGCEERDDCQPDSVTTTFTHGKKIKKEFYAANNLNYYTVEEGGNTVFEHVFSRAQCDNRIDDELARIFSFEINTEATQFRFVGDDVNLTNCFFNEVGGWARGMYEIEGGLIEGTKTPEGNWRVKVSVQTIPNPIRTGEQPEKIEFDEVFTK